MLNNMVLSSRSSFPEYEFMSNTILIFLLKPMITDTGAMPRLLDKSTDGVSSAL